MLLFARGTRTVSGTLRVPDTIAIGGLLGLAILAKGPIGLLLPAAAMGLFLLVINAGRTSESVQSPRDGLDGPSYKRLGTSAPPRLAMMFSPRNMLRTAWSMRPLTVLAAAALVAVPWFVLVALRTEWHMARAIHREV